MEEDLKSLIKLIKEDPSFLDSLNIEELENILNLLVEYESNKEV